MMVNLTPLLPHLPAWLLVLTRISGIFMLAPMFGSQAIPMRVKALLVFGLSLCVYPTLLDPARPSAALIAPVLNGGLSLWTLLPVAATELMIGLVIGYGASLPLMAMQIGGRVADQQLGFGLGGVFNPELDEQSGIVGEFYFIAALGIFILLGGHRAMMDTLVGSFQSVPLGGFRPNGQLLELLVGLLTAMFELTLRVAGPLLCLIFLETVAMGFIARTVPQMNILSIGFPLRILLGVAFLIAALATQGEAFVQSVQHTLRNLSAFFGT
jgi:flagellar biosynthesis protein FliR